MKLNHSVYKHTKIILYTPNKSTVFIKLLNSWANFSEENMITDERDVISSKQRNVYNR